MQAKKDPYDLGEWFDEIAEKQEVERQVREQTLEMIQRSIAGKFVYSYNRTRAKEVLFERVLKLGSSQTDEKDKKSLQQVINKEMKELLEKEAKQREREFKEYQEDLENENAKSQAKECLKRVMDGYLGKFDQYKIPIATVLPGT